MSKTIPKAKLSKHLDPLVHIREKPGMYISHVQNPIIITREIIDNAIDEVMAGAADELWVTIHKDESISVRDNGRGMPVDLIEVNGEYMPNSRASWTVPQTGSHYDKDKTSTSSGTHGIGSKTTLATSDKFTGEIWIDGKFYYDEYVYDAGKNQPGVPTVKLDEHNNYIPEKQSPENTPTNFTHGTRVRFWPSPDVFENNQLSWSWLKTHMHQQAYLHAGLKVNIINERTKESLIYEEKNGLKTYLQTLIDKSDGQLITQIHQFSGKIQTEDNVLNAKIAFAWTNSRNTTLLGFTNSVNNNQGGTHIDGFNNGIMKLLNQYVTKLNLAKEKLEARDTKPGLVAIVSILYSDPMYGSQTKDLLTTPEIRPAIQKITTSQGQLELDKYIQDVEAIVKQSVLRSETRKNLEDLSNIKLDKKSISQHISKKLEPAKKTGPNVNAELYIVEGDSAAGGLTRTRIQDKDADLYQAVMPIRGKIINVAKNSPKKVFENEEITTIIGALGAGYGKNFDESKLNYQKVILATDADADGAQISQLLRMFFFKYLRPLIENGHVYRAMSPLYISEIKINNKIEEKFAYTQQEQDALISKYGSKIKKVKRYKGLAEMKDPLVKKTLITPGSRKLVRYTVDDFDEAYANAELFMGPIVPPRKKYLFENAEFAEILETD